ncbi:MAG: DNA polymerase III subunit gamma/tau [Candidatus Roizmanbacteria bacterium]|nr:MAG: DNA polymerase III subunit gamma/tau [Candidatus Roizmanbacteria bacterium]
MFYHTYRPKTISELDNGQVKERVTAILENKTLPHAFLFTGQKGTGKTSTARIFAKAVNCLKNTFASHGSSVEPCNKCTNCLSIDSSSSPDVVELDAASNRGIDEIRSLIRNSIFSPMNNRYRIFIIDEAHMITHDAFNALLKTLEEPPSSVIFILATTNEEKVPKTISSRCIIIPFGKARKDEIKSMLKRIAVNEKITVDNDFFDIIAAHSEKSFRDATKLFQELIIQNRLTSDKAKEYLGIQSKQDLIQIIQAKPLKETLIWINEYSDTGGNVKILIENLLNDLRMALLIKSGAVNNSSQKNLLSINDITLLMKLLNEAYQNLRFSPIDSIPLEIAVVEFYNKRKDS